MSTFTIIFYGKYVTITTYTSEFQPKTLAYFL